MPRRAWFLVFALVVGACGAPNPLSPRVDLLTGIDACYAGGESPAFAGTLIPDAEYGTRIEGKGPVMWPVGYTATRQVTGEIVVLNRSGTEVARTGREYAIAAAPEQANDVEALRERVGAIAAPDCYSWDIVDCSPGTKDGDAQRCPPPED